MYECVTAIVVYMSSLQCNMCLFECVRALVCVRAHMCARVCEWINIFLLMCVHKRVYILVRFAYVRVFMMHTSALCTVYMKISDLKKHIQQHSHDPCNSV